jgi:hypothetical protein
MDSLNQLGEGRELKSTSFEDRPEGLDERSGDLEERPESLQDSRKKKDQVNPACIAIAVVFATAG